uniref:Putative secreted protein n=1 Tax=Culex tarsalis TaxID=7177 RepID=A0A1Q3FVG0_CULTA
MSSGKRSSYELTTPAADEERPHSFYDNLTTSPSGTSGSRVIQIPDIQFKFDDDIPMGRSSTLLMSNAKSDFFGLSKIPDDEPDDESDQRLLPSSDRRTPPTIVPRPADATTATSSSSPTSTASTVPAAPPGSPEDSPRSTSRPTSAQRNITIRLPEAGAPSEAVYMTTTVPQNFAKNSSTLIGRHKPTRSSLRHSRMLVVNSKNYHQRFPKGNSLNLRHIRLSRLLMLLKIAIGAVLTFVGMTIIVWSPNTATKDNPYWSGMILVASGALFLVLFDFKRRPANRLRENFFNFVRVNALVILLLTIFFTMLAFIYALIHTTNLSSGNLRCEPEYHFNVNSSSCVCLIDPRSPQEVAEAAMAVRDVRNEAGGRDDGGYFDRDEDDGEEDFGRKNLTTMAAAVAASTMGPTIMSGLDLRKAAEQLEDEGVIRLEYRDFNCSEVLSIWYYVTLGSTILNSLGCLLSAAFLVIYGVECQRREHELRYMTVRTNGTGEPVAAATVAPKIGETAVQDSGGKDEKEEEAEGTERPSSAANVTESIDEKTSEEM